MGQFGNQPDFATNSIQVVTPNNTISLATNLDSSIIYIGDNTTAGDVLVVIPAGTVGPSVISDFSSPGYAGSGGTGYTSNPAGTATTTTSGAGTGLTVKTTAVSGAITDITIGTSAGTGYLNGDLITVTGGGANAVFRIVAAPGLPTAAQSVAFHGLQAGGFLPVTVDYILASNATDTTSVEKLIAAK
jgi:hypothetical protein